MGPNEHEPPIREFQGRGTLWLLESPENLRGVIAILAGELADRLDFARAERINRSFVPADLHKQEADLLYRVPFRGGKGQVWVYVLLEHQSRPDRFIGLRLLAYMVQVWETQIRGWEDAKVTAAQRKLSPILPVVFCTGRRRWTSPLTLDAVMDIPEALSQFVPRHDALFLKLKEMPADALTGSAVACALRVLQAEDAPLDALERVLSDAVVCLEELSEEHQAEWRRAMHYLLLLIRHRRAPEEREELFEVITESVRPDRREEVDEMKMTDAESLMAQGRRDGRKEGHRELVLDLLEAKFGPLPPRVVSLLDAWSPERLRDLARRTLTAQSLADLQLEG